MRHTLLPYADQHALLQNRVENRQSLWIPLMCRVCWTKQINKWQNQKATVAEMHLPICVPPWPQPSRTNNSAKMTRTVQRPIAMIWPRPCARVAQKHQVRANLRHCDWSPNNVLINPQPRRPRLQHLRQHPSQKWPSMKHMKHRPNL